MKKIHLITLILVLLILFLSDRSNQEEVRNIKKNCLSSPTEDKTKGLFGFIITKNGKPIWEFYLGYSGKRGLFRMKNLSGFQLGSLHIYDGFFGYKIVVIIGKDAHELFKNNSDIDLTAFRANLKYYLKPLNISQPGKRSELLSAATKLIT